MNYYTENEIKTILARPGAPKSRADHQERIEAFLTRKVRAKDGSLYKLFIEFEIGKHELNFLTAQHFIPWDVRTLWLDVFDEWASEIYGCPVAAAMRQLIAAIR